MEFLRKILRREKKEQKVKENVEKSQKEIELEEDVIDLGWHWSENKREWQLAKIGEEDRKIHFYIIGASGTGKSKFLEFLIRQDIKKK